MNQVCTVTQHALFNHEPSFCPHSPLPSCFQGFRRTDPARRLAAGRFELDGSCSTHWSTTPHCWAPGSTSRHCRPLRVSWMAHHATDPKKAATRVNNQKQNRSSPPRPPLHPDQTEWKAEVMQQNWQVICFRIKWDYTEQKEPCLFTLMEMNENPPQTQCWLTII